MELTTTQLNYLLVCYSMVFSMAGLYFFVKASNMLEHMHDLMKSVINLIHRNGEHLSYEGTDAD